MAKFFRVPIDSSCFPPKTSVKSKKKVLTSLDVLSSLQMSVKSEKKVFTCSDVLLSSENSGAPRGVRRSIPPFFKVKCLNCASVVPVRAVISKQLRQNLPHIILKPNQLVGVVVREIVINAGKGRFRGGMHPPPPAILKHVFDEYNFSIYLNLFNNNEPHAQSTHNRKCTNTMQ